MKARRENRSATFEDIERAIAANCEKEYKKLNSEMERMGLTNHNRVANIERHKALAAEERRLSHEGKPIPGYKPDPWVTEVMECTGRINTSKNEYSICIDDALRAFIPVSTEGSEVVADAAMGACANKRSDLMRTSFCALKVETVSDTVAKLDQQLRIQAISKVVAARAALRQRELQQLPKELPRSTPDRRL